MFKDTTLYSRTGFVFMCHIFILYVFVEFVDDVKSISILVVPIVMCYVVTHRASVSLRHVVYAAASVEKISSVYKKTHTFSLSLSLARAHSLARSLGCSFARSFARSLSL